MLTRDLGLALQLILPHRLLSRLVYWAVRWRFKPWKNLLIAWISKVYGIDLQQAASSDLDDYPHFNAFFTRALRADARPLDLTPGALLSPADGRISQLGRIEQGRILQAKGMDYSAAELLGDAAEATAFHDGEFVTIYLSPRDYHRVHMPRSGRVRKTIHVPGRLFSVAPWTTEAVPRLFARNERLSILIETEHGPMAVVLVGAILVSSIETVFAGLHTPPYADHITTREYTPAPNLELAAGAELGRFNMGSTVILLLPKGGAEWVTGLKPDSPVRMGERLG